MTPAVNLARPRLRLPVAGIGALHRPSQIRCVLVARHTQRGTWRVRGVHEPWQKWARLRDLSLDPHPQDGLPAEVQWRMEQYRLAVVRYQEAERAEEKAERQAQRVARFLLTREREEKEFRDELAAAAEQRRLELEQEQSVRDQREVDVQQQVVSLRQYVPEPPHLSCSLVGRHRLTIHPAVLEDIFRTFDEAVLDWTAGLNVRAVTSTAASWSLMRSKALLRSGPPDPYPAPADRS